MAYFAIPTTLGQALLADAVAGVAPLDVSQMIIGDGNGNQITPLATQTALIRQRDATGIQTITRDPAKTNHVTFTGVLDETQGGYTIREAGLIDTQGRLLFVASIPDTAKLTLSDNVEDILTLALTVIVSDTAQITLTPAGFAYATQQFVIDQLEAWRTHIGVPLRPYDMPVISRINTPPTTPVIGDTYWIGDVPTGAFAGRIGQLAQWRGAKGWTFLVPPEGLEITVANLGVRMRRVNGTWRRRRKSTLFASLIG